MLERMAIKNLLESILMLIDLKTRNNSNQNINGWQINMDLRWTRMRLWVTDKSIGQVKQNDTLNETIYVHIGENVADKG